MASGNDMQAARKTYDGFMTLLKWSVPAIAILTLLIVVGISS
jgi:predicted RND superfamily exporter protein